MSGLRVDHAHIENPFKIQTTRQNNGSPRTEIVVISAALIAMLKEACINYPGSEYQVLFSNRVRFREPFMMLFYNLESITDTISAVQGTERYAFDQLIDFLMDLNTWQTLQKLDLNTTRVITFDQLWLLYRPGTTIFQRPKKDGESWEAFKVGNVSYRDLIEDDGREFRIKYYSLTFDEYGKTLIPLTHELLIGPYIGERFISDLELMPSDHMPTQQVQSLRNTLEKRGRKYWSFNSAAVYQKYQGNAWRVSRHPEKLEVMVDYSTASRVVPTHVLGGDRYFLPSDGCACSACCQKYAALPLYPPDRSGPQGDCPRDMYPVFEPPFSRDNIERNLLSPFIFFPSQIDAYSLQYKSWRAVDVNTLSTPEKSAELLDSLILAEQSKLLLNARIDISMDARREPQSENTGLVIVCKGPPGSGKSMTARAMSLAKCNPLIILSWSELMVRQQNDCEKLIKETFNDAENWGAMLLIEDADLLFQPSKAKDPKAENFALAMLRRLEQYRGVLFSVTIQTDLGIDERLRSRIDIVVQFPLLIADSRAKIWGNIIQDTTNREELVNLTTMISTFDLNGHQLRNCLRTAVALARHGDKPISIRHIEFSLYHDAEFMASGSLIQRQGIERNISTSQSIPHINRGVNASPLRRQRPAAPSRSPSGRSVHFRDEPSFPFPLVPPTFTSRPIDFSSLKRPPLSSPSISVTSPSSPASTAVTDVPSVLSPGGLLSSAAALSPLRSPRPQRPARPSRPSMLRRHTTQSSLDPEGTGARPQSPHEGWTWKMLPAHVRRPQLQFEKGLPGDSTDEEGFLRRRKSDGKEDQDIEESKSGLESKEHEKEDEGDDMQDTKQRKEAPF